MRLILLFVATQAVSAASRSSLSITAAAAISSRGGGSTSRSTSTSYNPYEYDLTVPQFTPDGRLLQAEYARLAADRSSPIISAQITTRSGGPDRCERAPLAIFACCSDGASRRPPLQERLILLPSLSSQFGSSATSMEDDVESTIVVALAGIRADSILLLQTIQEAILSQHRIYGTSSGSGDMVQNPQMLASWIATKCQSFVFGGGLRPLGSTVWVTSNTNWCGSQNKPALVLHQTEPSGSIQDVFVGTDRNVAVLGGESSAVRRLQRRLETEWTDEAEASDTTDMDTTRASFDEQQRRSIGHLLAILADEHSKNAASTDTSQKRRYETNDSLATSEQTPHVEVVLLSPTRGVVKLLPDQVQDMLTAYHDLATSKS